MRLGAPGEEDVLATLVYSVRKPPPCWCCWLSWRWSPRLVAGCMLAAGWVRGSGSLRPLLEEVSRFLGRQGFVKGVLCRMCRRSALSPSVKWTLARES